MLTRNFKVVCASSDLSHRDKIPFDKNRTEAIFDTIFSPMFLMGTTNLYDKKYDIPFVLYETY
jgi:hypothetical protein